MAGVGAPKRHGRARNLRGAAALALAILGLVVAACAAPAVKRSEAASPALGWEASLRRDHPLAGRILHPASGRVVGESALLAELARADFVLLGERHDHPDHHRLQARVLEGLAAGGRRPAVVFEMLRADVALALAAWRGETPATSEGLRRAVAWDASGWPDFDLYRPVFEAALAADLPIAAGDAPRALLSAGPGGEDEIPAPEVARLGLAEPMPEKLRRAHEEEIRRAHCGHAPEERLPAMARVQWLRDAHLAAALVEAAGEPGASGAVLIAGAGHVRRDRGVPWHLARLAPGASVAAVGLLELPHQAEGVADASELLERLSVDASAFDWLWLTPALDDLDPCERFREQLETLSR